MGDPSDMAGQGTRRRGLTIRPILLLIGGALALMAPFTVGATWTGSTRAALMIIGVVKLLAGGFILLAQYTPALTARPRGYRFYDLILGTFVTVLLCSNLIGPGKTCLVFGLTFGAGNIFFPISYIFDDVLTEVYGYSRSRKAIWAGFAAMVFATIMGQTVIHLPADPGEPFNKVMQPALETCFGGTWRIVIASMAAFWAGDFANSYVLAKMKILTKGRWLWTRTIGSTIVGEGLDSLIFYPLAFASAAPLFHLFGAEAPEALTRGTWSGMTVLKVVCFNWFFKTMVEVVMTPVTYAVVGFLKRAESEDYYDIGTNFNPFRLKD